jgi:hypothetical protein
MAKTKKSAVDEAVKGAKRGAAKGWNDSVAVAKGSAKILMDAAKAIEKQLSPFTHSGSKFATHRREAAAARKAAAPKKKPASRAPSYLGERTATRAAAKKAVPGPKVRRAMKTTSARKTPRSPRGKYGF